MKNILYIITLALFTSCINDSSNLVEFQNLKYFNNKEFLSNKILKHQVFNDNFIGYPVRITKIDTLLFAVDMKMDTLVHAFSTNSKSYLGQFVSRGNGPKELITCSEITPSNNNANFWAFDITSVKWMEYNINSLFNRESDEKTEEINFKKEKFDYTGVNQPKWISNDLFVFNSLFKYKERFYIFDKNLNLKKEVYNPNLKITSELPENILGDIFSSFMDVKPDKSKIVLVGRYLDAIEIYDTEGNLLTMLKGPDKLFDFKFDIESSLNRGAMIKLQETRRAYIGVKTTNQQIYVLYSGKERKDPTNYSYSNIIYTFDWDGNPINKYELDAQISSFAIDEKNNIIYALHHDAYLISYNI